MDISKQELIGLFKKFINSTKTVLSEIPNGMVQDYFVSLSSNYTIRLRMSSSFHTGWQTNYFTLKLKSTDYTLTEEEGTELQSLWYIKYDVIDIQEIENLLNS